VTPQVIAGFQGSRSVFAGSVLGFWIIQEDLGGQSSRYAGFCGLGARRDRPVPVTVAPSAT
jgi:hypothetical protein